MVRMERAFERYLSQSVLSISPSGFLRIEPHCDAGHVKGAQKGEEDFILLLMCVMRQVLQKVAVQDLLEQREERLVLVSSKQI